MTQSGNNAFMDRMDQCPAYVQRTPKQRVECLLEEGHDGVWHVGYVHDKYFKGEYHWPIGRNVVPYDPYPISPRNYKREYSGPDRRRGPRFVDLTEDECVSLDGRSASMSS